MKLYMAGVYTSNFSLQSRLYQRLNAPEKAARDGVRWFLESYHYIHKQSFVDRLIMDQVKVFLDSGAFSAFTKGVDVDLPGYCEYIHRNRHIIAEDDGAILASVLDGIGDPAKTLENQLAMEALGVRPLPCFHYGEDERYLEFYIKNYDYITIGGMVPISTAQLFYWLDRIWDKYLTDGAGRPRVKVHGFGLTTHSLMVRYPWYSVDSSRWVQAAAMGGIMLPDWNQIIAVSRESPARKTRNAHFVSLPTPVKEAILRYVAWSGFEFETLEAQYLSRWCYNLWAFTRMEDLVNAVIPSTFALRQGGLF